MSKIITLPGLIDVHTHLREPGATQKEDFLTGTQAAIAGGFVAVLDMPNNKEPITTKEKLEEKIELARKNAACDIGFYFGSLGDNLDEFEKVKDQIFGIKLYLNSTTGNFLIDEEKLTKIYQSWDSTQPILLHCEGETLPMALKVIKESAKLTHICHVSSADELSQIMKAKEEGLPITCGVTPHHLFLTEADVKNLGPFGLMKPFLKSQKDQDYLWQNLDVIDVIESDHAPHTKMEKNGANPPLGVPGLETTLPLLLTAASEGKLTIEDITRLCYTNPAKIFNIPTDSATRVEVDENEEYEIKNEDLKTKCGWSPFAGRKVQGKVKTVFIRGKKVFEDGQILVNPGFGKIIHPTLDKLGLAI